MNDSGGGDDEGGGVEVTDGGESRVADRGFGDGDQFTTIVHNSWISRMKNSVAMVGCGFALFVVSFGVLFWNEGRAVKRQQTLDDGEKIVMPITDLETHNPRQYYDKLVYLTGLLEAKYDDTDATTPFYDLLFDMELENSTNGALKYTRIVDTYQWVETQTTKTTETSGGGTKTTTTYSYKKEWSRTLVSSASFHDQSGHENPTQYVVQPLELQAHDMLFGEAGLYSLGQTAKEEVNWWERWPNPPLNPSKVGTMYFPSFRNAANPSVPAQVEPDGGAVYIGFQMNNRDPAVGDTRVFFQLVPSSPVSVVARCVNRGDDSTSDGDGRGACLLEPHGKGKLLLFGRGTITSAELFSIATSNNRSLTWLLRFVGFFVMFVGAILVMQPLATFADAIPLVGDFLADGLNYCALPAIALVVSVPSTMLTISVGWCFYRPVFSTISVLLFIVMVVGAIMYSRHQQAHSEQPQQQPNTDTKPDPEKMNTGDAEEPDLVVQAEPVVENSPEWFGSPK